ncbi:MAG: single-stranded DNA-binding protein [Candidatus Dojkabacteria bacterium]
MSAKSLNKVLLIGNLTRDPEVKVTPSGASVCTFGLATNSRYKKPDGNYEEITNFHNIVAWSKLADICAAKLRKGMKIYVEGELRTRTWDDQDSGKRMHKTEVRITEMIIMKEGAGRENGDENAYSEAEDNSEVTMIDDLPI